MKEYFTLCVEYSFFVKVKFFKKKYMIRKNSGKMTRLFPISGTLLRIEFKFLQEERYILNDNL
jgi:hypothetical protein